MPSPTREEVVRFLGDGARIIIERVDPQLIKVGSTVEAVIAHPRDRQQTMRVRMTFVKLDPVKDGNKPVPTLLLYIAQLFDGSVEVAGEVRTKRWRQQFGTMDFRAAYGWRPS